MERKVGEFFTTKDGVRLQVEESPCCDKCYYKDGDECSMLYDEVTPCFSLVRKDNKSVIFKKI